MSEKELSAKLPHDILPMVGPSASFLDALVIDYGPLQLLGRFFAAMDLACAARGVSLSLEKIETASQIQAMRQADRMAPPIQPASQGSFWRTVHSCPSVRPRGRQTPRLEAAH